MTTIVTINVYKTSDNAQDIFTYNEGTQIDKHNYENYYVNTNNKQNRQITKSKY